MMTLDHQMPFSRSTMESLKHFIQGHTKKNHPIDIIHALYHHPYAHPSSRHEPLHRLLSGFAVPLDDHQPIPKSDEKGNTYSELQQYFVDQSIRHIKFEMDGLLWDDYWCATNSETGKFDWDVVLSFSIKSAQDIIMEKHPLFGCYSPHLLSINTVLNWWSLECNVNH